ncbi:cyclin-A2-4-like [Tasmannia lanceolata]|uniref:cyclin-A2-4-like n=1 Tax=Tasmannia lanceolata TaxID=3420 RepID=UPI00406499EC
MTKMKENEVISGHGEPTARLTRARAAACRSTAGKPPLKPSSMNQDQKLVLRGNSKRAASDENNHTAPVAASLQHKKRAVLKDVTNVFCENSYKNCVNAAKMQTRISKKAKPATSKKNPKVTPVVSVETKQVQGDAKKTTAEEIWKMGILEEISVSAELEENISAQPLMGSVKNGKNVTCELENPLLGKHNSRKPSEVMNPSKKAEEKLCVDLGCSHDLDFTDIDSDQKNPQMCSLYAPAIYANLRVAELIRRPCPDFMERLQRDITQSMRGILVDWLVEVSEEYKLVPDTLYLTVYIIDRFLSQNYIERQKLQLLGITCMLIASKYEEICAPRVEEFCFITDNTYTRGEVLKMESQVLNYMGFQLSAPTIKSFLRRYLRAAQASYKVPTLILEFLANYLAELTLVEYGFLKFLPSVIAASAVFLARWTIDQSGTPWNLTLEHYTTYKALDLKATVIEMQDLQMNSKGCPLHAIREKYRQHKFKCVASLTSPKLLETLF